MENNNSSDRIPDFYLPIFCDDFDWYLASPNRGFSNLKAIRYLYANLALHDTIYNSKVTLHKGDIIVNVSKFAEEWNWSRDSIYKFFDKLESLKIIKTQKIDRFTLVSFIQYSCKESQDASPVISSDVNNIGIEITEENTSDVSMKTEDIVSVNNDSESSSATRPISYDVISNYAFDWMDGHILDEELCAKLDMLDGNKTPFEEQSEDVIKTVMSAFITTAYRKWGVPKQTVPEDALYQILQVSLSLYKNDCRNEILIWLRSLRRFSLATTYRCLEGDDAPLIAANHEILRSAFHYFGLKFLQDFRKPCKFLDCDFG